MQAEQAVGEAPQWAHQIAAAMSQLASMAGQIRDQTGQAVSISIIVPKAGGIVAVFNGAGACMEQVIAAAANQPSIAVAGDMRQADEIASRLRLVKEPAEC